MPIHEKDLRLFDIIIPTYNNFPALKRCLKSFESQTIQQFHIWICIDGSTDETVDFFEDSPGFNFSYNALAHADKMNHGRASARNMALPFIRAPYVIFLDSDLYVNSDFLESHLKVMQQAEVISVGSIEYEKGNIWRDYALSRGKHQYNNLAEVPYKYFETGNAAIPSKPLLELKGFDEWFETYGGEDTELACRLWKNYRLPTIYNQQAAAFGRMDKTLETALKQREDFAKTGLKYIRKKHPWANDVFNVKVLDSNMVKPLLACIHTAVLMTLAKSRLFPKKCRLSFVHLLVFYYMYKGYHNQ